MILGEKGAESFFERLFYLAAIDDFSTVLVDDGQDLIERVSAAYSSSLKTRTRST